MEERPLFKEDLDYAEIVQYLVNIVQENLTNEQFNNMSNEKLKENCSFVMATEVLSKIGQDFTPEQMAIFIAPQNSSTSDRTLNSPKKRSHLNLPYNAIALLTPQTSDRTLNSPEGTISNILG